MSQAWTWKDHNLPKVMGIVNTTPDSFYDGGRYHQTMHAMNHVNLLLTQGSDYIDIGGESSRPGAQSVSEEVEYQRCIPLIIDVMKQHPKAMISIDTVKPRIAEAAIQHGAAIINDIQGLRDPMMREVAARTGAGVIIMHMRGLPQTMQQGDLSSHDIISEIMTWLDQQIELSIKSGIKASSIALDPGIGFGKTVEQNLAILSHIHVFKSLGYPILIGTSRKSFIGHLTGADVNQRLAGSLASALYAIQKGADIVRVHDVAATQQAITVMRACHNATLDKVRD